MDTPIELKILAVDDSEQNLSLLKGFFARSNHQLITATSGEEAIKLFKLHRPVLVLMDVMMPGMDGFETTSNIRAMCGDSWIPIVFMSADVRLSSQVKGLITGGDDYLLKPINLILLDAKIKSMMRVINMQEKLAESNQQLNAYFKTAEMEKDLAKELLDRMTHIDEEIDQLAIWRYASDSICGDVVAAIRTPDKSLYIMLADAAGHGLVASISLLPAVIRFNQLSKEGKEIREIAHEINKILVQMTPDDRFIAATLLALNLENRTFEILNAGNPPSLLVDESRSIVEKFESGNFPLGLVDVTPESFQLHTGAWTGKSQLVFYSDGLPEAGILDGGEFGDDRIESAIAQQNDQNVLEALKGSVLDYTTDKRIHDDITVITLQLT